ncbi:MAG: ABC transporter permease [Chloroflexota bacterium]|nr:ABC transporter permease [Chloroflexota bacterium]
MTNWSRLAGLRRWETLLVVLLIALLAWGTARSSFFLDGSNFTIASSAFMERALMALPMTLIIIAGEIDLSVASILGLASAVLGITYAAGVPLWLGVVLALATGIACGLLNGILVTRFALPSLVVTLGTLALFRGLAYVILGGPQGQVAISSYPAELTRIGFGTIPGTVIPWSFILFTALLVIFFVLLHKSWVGRQIYSVGLNQDAARFAAVRVARLKLSLFVLSGFIAAVAGILYTARISSSRADNALGFELDVIAAVLLGGVSIFGGRGTIIGVLLSLAVVATLRNVLAITNVGPDIQNFAVGGLLILSVLGPNLVRRVLERRPSLVTTSN